MEFLQNWWIFVIVIVTIIGWHIWSRRKLYLFASQLPGPAPYSLEGHAFKFAFAKTDVLKRIVDLVDKYPSPMKLWAGPALIIFVKEPNHLQTILQSSKITTKAFMYRFMEELLGKGLLTSGGLQHKNDRKFFQNFFSQKMVDGYSHLFQKHANKLVDRLKKQVDGPEFDVINYLNEQTVETAMDVFLENKNIQSTTFRTISKYIRRYYFMFVTRVTRFWLHLDLIYRWTSLYKEQVTMKDFTNKIMSEILNKRVVEIKKELENGERQPSEELRTPSLLEEIIAMKLENPNYLTTQEWVNHLYTFIAASHDTQSAAMAFTLMMLGAYPNTQKLVVQEIKEVLGKRTSLDLTDVSKLKYLDMCLKESIRLFPVAPFTFRVTTEEFPLDNWTIPEGVIVGLSYFNLHRDPRHWEKPTEFYPEHFSPEAVSKRHPYAFIPFSAGPRNCIAHIYSPINMKIIISTVLLNYEVQCLKKVEDIDVIDLSVRPVGGYMIKLKNR